MDSARPAQRCIVRLFSPQRSLSPKCVCVDSVNNPCVADRFDQRIPWVAPSRSSCFCKLNDRISLPADEYLERYYGVGFPHASTRAGYCFLMVTWFRIRIRIASLTCFRDFHCRDLCGYSRPGSRRPFSLHHDRSIVVGSWNSKW